MSGEVAKGTGFETDVCSFLAESLGDDRIERRAKCGSKDRGDVAGFRIRGKRCVVECKNHRRMELSKWLDEAEAERGNDGAEFAFVVHKRKGRGKAHMGDTYVTCTLETLAAIAAGSRDLLGGD